MDERKFIKKCKELVRNYYNDRAESTDKNGKITTEDVFVVWFCKTLQNSKALLSIRRYVLRGHIQRRQERVLS